MSTRSAVSSRPAPPRDGDYRPDPDRWKALAVVLAAGFMTLLDVSIVNVALPSVEQGLNAQQNALQWIVAGYALHRAAAGDASASRAPPRAPALWRVATSRAPAPGRARAAP